MLSLIFNETSTVTPMTASCSPESIYEETGDTSGAFSGSLTVSVLDAVGTVTYSWSESGSSGDGTISILSSTSASTSLTFAGLTYTGAEASAVLTCTATDSLGSSAFANVAVYMVRTSGGGAPP